MSANKFNTWVDVNNRKTCLKIAQQYYIARESGTKFRLFRKRLIILFIKRLFFLFINLFRFSNDKNTDQQASGNSRPFFKRLLGLYKFEVPGLLPQKPIHKPLVFKIEDQPAVSIIIAVHNHFDYTYNCLHSILLNTQQVPYEIILVNDCSSDGTSQLIKQAENIVYLENEENIGFLRSCNKAAQVARGKYLCFLNNDTQVSPGWLSSMTAVFTDHKNTGLVGARLIYPYGLLQEAGGIVNYLGQPANYGRYSDPYRPEFSYLREADYCSGACILVLKADFEQLGGFDKRYIPAYYEDTDLSFAIRYQLNKKVYYQPLARIIHFEGISSGKTIVAGTIKEYQLINAEKFTDKWASILQFFPQTTSHELIATKFGTEE